VVGWDSEKEASMSDTHVIRPLKDDDFDAFLKYQEVGSVDEETWGRFQRLVQGDAFFGLFVDGLLIGHLNLLPFGDDSSHFQGVYILSEHRGKGYGNLFMEHALEWYREQGSIRKVHLYTEQTNKVAQNLYKKYGFEITSEAWHFFVPFDSLSPQNKHGCEEIQEDEIDVVGASFESAMPASYIRRNLSSERTRMIKLVDGKGDIAGVCRLNPNFPGCFPFAIGEVDVFDDFIEGLREFSSDEFDYVRVTFFGIPELANLCKSRKYQLHHELFRMTRRL
jgi:ribosomal protein S18 acetylase RimI-like enzyme